jgi:hypothetical protein
MAKESIAEKVLNSGCSREEIIEWKKEKKRKAPKKYVSKRSKLKPYAIVEIWDDMLEEAKASADLKLSELNALGGVQVSYPTDKLTKAQIAHSKALAKFERSEAKHVIKRHLDGCIARKNLGHLTRKKAIRAVGFAPEEVTIEPGASWDEIADMLRFLGLEDEILRIQKEALERVERPKALDQAEAFESIFDEHSQAEAFEEAARELERKKQSRADRFDKAKLLGVK